MKNLFLILIYILGFIFISMMISQIPAILKGEDLFINNKEILLSVIAGTASGLIVGFFNTKEIDEEK